MFSLFNFAGKDDDTKAVGVVTPAVQEEAKISSLVPLSRTQLLAAARPLTYALPALIASTSKGGKGRKGGKVVKFPSPARASGLNKVYSIIQTLPLANFNSSTAVTTFTGTSVAFSVLDQATSLANVFDQYRIPMVEVTFIPVVNINDVQASTMGSFASCVDLDDQTALSTYNAALDYQGCISTEGFKEHKHTFVPHIAVAAYSGTFVSFANEAAPWIDAGSPNVAHYGVKTAWTATTAVCTYSIRIRVMVQLRNVR
jgi:hypothetical protein